MKMSWHHSFKMSKSSIVRLVFILTDILSVNLAYLLTLFIRFYLIGENNELYFQYNQTYWDFVPVYTVFCLAVFFFCRLYTRSWRYASTNDLNWILIANLITCTGQIVGTLMFTKRMPLTYYALGAMIQLVFTVTSRFSYKLLMLEVDNAKKRWRNNQPQKKTMLIGIGETAHQVLRHLEEESDSKLVPVCMVDFSSQNYVSLMEGIPVVHGVDAIANAITDYGVESVILADSNMPGTVRKKVREICDAHNLEVQDYIGYFQQSWGAMTIGSMVAYASCEVELITNGVHRIFPNGSQASQFITDQHSLKAVYTQNSRLILELQTPLTLMYITNDPIVAQIAEKTVCSVYGLTWK